MEVLGIFLGSIYGWCTVGFIWPSFLGMILLGLTQYGTISAVFGEGFGNETVLMLFMTFAFFSFINSSGLMTFIANRFIGLKINIGHPWRLTFFFFFIAAFVGGITNNIATALLLWFIFFNICKETGMKKGDKYVSFIVCGIMFFATFSIVMFPFLPFSLVGINLMSQAVDFSADSTLGWLISGPIIMVLLIILYMLVGRFIFKVDISKLESYIQNDNFSDLRNKKMTKSERIGLVYLLLFILIIVLPTFLPKTWALSGILSNISVIGACALCIIGICFPKNEKGKTTVPFDKLATGISWDVVLLMVATVPICSAIEAEETGIISSFMALIMPLLSSIEGFSFMALVIIVLGLTTQVTHNFILLIVFGPVLVKIAVSYGIPPIVFCCVFMFMIMTAVATPGASANSAMIFGNSDWVDAKHALILGWIFAIIALAVYIFIAYPLNMLLV
ncbi:MAG: SLC13 family permease [Peptococcaceae bacterium]|nr:SLC13 family permease [Peptococcaceae bacterium]